jgi:aminopeptidase N
MGMSRRSFVTALGVLGAAGCGSGLAGVPAQSIDAAPTSLDPYFPGYGSGGYLVNHYALDLSYSSTVGVIAGTASVRILPFAALSGLSLDLAADMTVLSVKVDGAAATFERQSHKLHIRPPKVLRNGQMAVLEIAYTGVPQAVSVAGVGNVGWQPMGGGVGVVALPIGAFTWYPCADHPTLKAAYEISVTAPSDLTMVANGKLVGKTPQNFGTKWTYRHDGPMATCLTTAQIGEFTVDTSNGPNGVQLRNAYPKHLAGPAAYDLGRQGQMLTTFAGLFGPYPFDVFGTAALDGLPVQHFGAQTLGLIQSSAIDGKRTHEDVVARNLAHQWFGASVSVASWRDAWLSSAFATYGSWLWSEKSGGSGADTLARAAMAGLRTSAQDFVLADPGAQRILDPRVELRGACFLHTLRLNMGDTTFFELLRVWCNRNQSGTAQTGDFTGLVPNVYSGQDLTYLMNQWVFRAPLPDLPDHS